MSIIRTYEEQEYKEGYTLSKSNVLSGVTPVITNPSGDDPSNLSDYDHSLNYTCNPTPDNFIISYGEHLNVNYVGISGHNSATSEQATIELYDEDELLQAVVLTRNHNIMFTFSSRSFTDLRIKFVRSPSFNPVTVSYIAAGEAITIESGEQAGYSRAWLKRGIVQSMSTNAITAPISGMQKGKALSATLSLPNELATFIEGEWQDFIDFSYTQPFFVKEVSNKPESTYLCYNPIHDVRAHPQTRVLDAVTCKFDAFNGL